ncbi:MAG: protein BatD [Candidatus Omnitrophica bacterium]|nr:protein BatD [Candidatus Omnitrophota bacterium]
MTYRFAPILALAGALLGSVILWTGPVNRAVAKSDITVEATVDSNSVALGSEINLAITFKGTKDVTDIIIPDIDGFEKRYIGPFTNISIVNNSYTESVSHRFKLLPLRTGNFQIPTFHLELNGEQFSTQPIAVTVTDPAAGGGNQQQISLNDKIFLQLQIENSNVYLNEPVVAKVFMFYSDIKVRDIQYPKIEHIGFIDEAFGQPKQYERVIDGRRFRIIEFTKLIYPTRTGELTVGPAQLQCSIVFRAKNRRSRSPFDDGFFGSMFESYESRPMVLTSLPVMVTVKDLPKEGMPADFGGAVGQYSFNATVSPTEVQVGDPITLRMYVEGRGNLKAINFPEVVSEEDFKIYDPIIKEEGQTKTLEQVLIPKSTTVKEVPKVAFTFYNNETDKYETVEKGPFKLTIKEAEQAEDFRVVGLQEQQPVIMSQEKLGEDIVFIKDDPGRLRPVGHRVYRNWMYYAVVGLFALLYLGGYLLYRVTHRMETDQSFARRRQASRIAQTDLKVLHKKIIEKPGQEFYDHLFQLFQQYIRHKLQLPAGKASVAVIRAKLEPYQVEEEILKEIGKIYAECDAIRYASRAVKEGDMQASHQRVVKVIEYLERKIR